MAKEWWEDLGDALGTSQGTGLSVPQALEANRAIQRGDPDALGATLRGADWPSQAALDRAVQDRQVLGGLDWPFISIERDR